MRPILCGILIAASYRLALAQTQPAIVTFYSAGCRACLKGLVFDAFFGSTVVPYGGTIYDGPRQLIKQITPNRFVTLRMTPGTHTFAGDSLGVVALKRKRADKQNLSLTLQPGQRYFVNLSTKDSGITFTFRRFTPILVSRTCQEAFEEAAQTEPLQPKRIGRDRMTEVEPAVYFPICGGSSASNR